MSCIHTQVQADFKASRNRDSYFVCFRVWCSDCLCDFKVTEDIQISADERQMMVRIEPRNALPAPMNHTEH